MAANKALATHHCEPAPVPTLADIDDLIDVACKTFRAAITADDTTHDSDYARARREIRRAIQQYGANGTTNGG